MHTHTHTHITTHTTTHTTTRTHTHYTQGEHLKLVPLSATTSPNISDDEHNLSDTEVNEHLYSLGRFVPSSKPGSVSFQPLPHSSPEAGHHHPSSSTTNVVKRRVTHSAATSNLLANVNDHGSIASLEDTGPLPPSGHSGPMAPSANEHKTLSPQRSHTFSAPNHPKSGLHHQMVSN